MGKVMLAMDTPTKFANFKMKRI